MPRKRFTEEQIIGILKESDAGMKATEICRKYGISDCTFYTWKSKYGGMQVSEVRKMRLLEDENRKLKMLVADLTLDNQALKAINSKNF